MHHGGGHGKRVRPHQDGGHGWGEGGGKRQRIAPPRDFDFDPTSPPASGDDNASSKGEFRPSMLTFKAFLSTQDDGITDDEAFAKFTEYKKEFNRQQLNELFVAHKAEEWLQEKYHPDHVQGNKTIAANNAQKRLKVFLDLLDEGELDGLVLRASNSTKIELLLDTFVARLEGAVQGPGLLDPQDSNREQLCRTTSIHLRTIHPLVTREELISLLSKYPGFKRLCLAEPTPEARWARKGWASFQRDARIKEICFNLSTVRMKESDLNPVLNKDLSRRIRCVPAVSNDKTALRSCLQLATKLVNILDVKHGLWTSQESAGNPLLENITEYLVEEMSAEEDELLGCSSDDNNAGGGLETDVELAAVLDKLVLYLRFVHSIDLLNASHYTTEDEMPNRCGIFHVRDEISDEAEKNGDVTAFKDNLMTKVNKLIGSWSGLTDDMAKELGLRSEDDAVELFVQSSTEDLGSNKYLCKICGKKFKGTEFLKKHIFNKHEEKIDVVRKEVEFFNNYIRDPRRPTLPEKPKQTSTVPSAQPKPEQRTKENIPIQARLSTAEHRGSVKDRLGYKKNNILISYSNKDPRAVVDYSDVEFSDIFS